MQWNRRNVLCHFTHIRVHLESLCTTHKMCVYRIDPTPRNHSINQYSIRSHVLPISFHAVHHHYGALRPSRYHWTAASCLELQYDADLRPQRGATFPGTCQPESKAYLNINLIDGAYLGLDRP